MTATSIRPYVLNDSANATIVGEIDSETDLVFPGNPESNRIRRIFGACTHRVFKGLRLSKGFLGGLFSLDEVHPSNIGHAILANEFIRTMNVAFGMNIPERNQDVFDLLTLLEPALDKDKDRKATGRPGVGLIETLAYVFGISGDPDNLTPN